jgi:hypothetical protein
MVTIEYVRTGKRRDMKPVHAEVLQRIGVARAVYDTRATEPEAGPSNDDGVEISERTGKPKRKYKRRDMVAEG